MKKLLAIFITLVLFLPLAFGQSEEKKHSWLRLFDSNYLGRLSKNKFAPDSTSNKFGIYGSRDSPKSINNPYSIYGSAAQSEFSSGSNSPLIRGEDGTYLGRLNRNRFDADSISNPFGRYGSKFSPDSINNPYGKYGSPYSPYSATNPYAIETPKIYAPTAPQYELPGLSDPLDSLLDDLWEDTPY
ncbi:MAG: hypothetical protein IH937_14195 [Acidobacteria bacterium]|nr:hypothetical protein [Acidobacteriota bacterium]